MAFDDFATEAEDAARIAAASTLPAGEDLLDVTAGSAADEPPYPPYDPVLDEDIFHFDSVRPQKTAEVEYVSRAAILAPEPAPEPIPEPEPARTAPSASRPSIARETEREEVSAELVDAPLPRASATAPATTAGGARAGGSFFAQRTTQVAIAGVLAVNAALIFLAWQASRVFRDAVREAREEIVLSRDAAGADRRATPEPRALPEPAPSYEPSPRTVDEWVAQLDSPVDITFRIAEREIEEGEHAAARRRLYALLATRDRTSLSPERVADAYYAIARAWERESAALAASGAPAAPSDPEVRR